MTGKGNKTSRKLRGSIGVYLAILATLIFVLLALSGVILARNADETAGLFTRFQSGRVASHFRAHITPHLVLLHQSAASINVSRWLAYEELASKALAEAELAVFTSQWPYAQVHFVARHSQQKYNYVDGELQRDRTMSIMNNYDSWYFYTQRSNAPFSMRVQTSITGERYDRLMISQRVHHNDVNVGVVSVSIPFYALFDTLFDDEATLRFYIIDRTGSVQFDSLYRGFQAPRGISDIDNMPELLALFGNMMMIMESGAFPPGVAGDITCLEHRQYRYGGVMPIAGTDWLTVTLYPRYFLIKPAGFIPLITAALVILIFTFILLKRARELRPDRQADIEQAEKINLRTDSRLKTVISNYSGVIWSVDNTEKITIFSGLALGRHGLQPGLYEGKHLSEIPENWKDFGAIACARDTFAHGPQQRTIHVGDDAFIVRTAPILNDKGMVTDVVGNLVDVTESADLQKKLEAALEEARSASKAKSNFLSTMSHEMRTPLNTIIGMCGIGKDAPELSRKDYAYEKISEASVHLLSVINDVLDMSKIEAGMLTLSNEPFYLKKAINKALAVTNFRIEEKNLRYSFNIGDGVPDIIVADDHRLTQVLTNLLGNAVKFTPEGRGIHLAVSLIDARDDYCSLRFDVIDEGIGLSKEQQEHLFESFVQAQASISREYGGTGLGLAISKHIVESMGGEIWVESEQGQGATFSFTILADIGRKEDLISTPVEAKKLPDYRGYRLLMAEDLDTNREILQTILERSNMQIESALNGAQALQLFGANPGRYDLIFMDVNMPLMDGYAATRAIRALPDHRAKSVPIIAMSANVFKEDVDRCLESGMNDHIGKPINVNELIDKLEKYLGRGNIAPDPLPISATSIAPAISTTPTSSPMSPTSDTLIDFDEGLVRMMNNKKAYKRVLATFEGPRLMAEIDAAVRGGDKADLVKIAHALKGAAANLGLVELATVSGNLEQLAKLGMPLDEVLALHRVAMDKTIAAINDYIS